MKTDELIDELQSFGYLENNVHFCPFQAQVDLMRLQADEIKALRKQLIAACNEIMEIRR